MSSGPHQMNIGWLVLSRMRSAVRKLCGQVSCLPSGLADQSQARVNAPISPPPARKSAEVGLLIFNMRDWRPTQPNFSCRNELQPRPTRWARSWFPYISPARQYISAGAADAVNPDAGPYGPERSFHE